MAPVWSSSGGLGAALAVLLCGAACSGNAAAGPNDKTAVEPATRLSGITVTAPETHETPGVAHAKIQAFIQSHGAVTRIGRLGRWRDPICPLTVGLPPTFDDFVSARVKDDAAKVGAPMAKAPDCMVNVVIVFSPTPQAFLDRVAKKAPVLLGYHDASQTKKLATFNHPIQAWYSTATRGSRGEQSLDDALGHQPVGMSDTVNGPMGRGMVRVGDSRISDSLSTVFGIVLVVADLNKVANQEIGGVSDYVALLTLSQPASLDGCDPLPSIIDLMSTACDGRPKPDAMTESDIAYLKALYATNAETSAALAKTNIASRMASSVEHR
jgi:hypothetical protein